MIEIYLFYCLILFTCFIIIFLNLLFKVILYFTVILSAKQSVINIIKKFRFEELEAAVLPVFPEFSWKNIKSQLVENHESLTTVRAVKIIEEEINVSAFFVLSLEVFNYENILNNVNKQ